MVLVFINDVTPPNFEKSKMIIKMDKVKCGIYDRTHTHSSEGTSAEDSRARRKMLKL